MLWCLVGGSVLGWGLGLPLQVPFDCEFHFTSTALPVASYSFPLNLSVPVCVPVTLVVNLQHGSSYIASPS